MPIVVLRLLVCIVPLVADPITPFSKGLALKQESPHEDPLSPYQIARGAFMLLVGISWSVGLFMAALLLLPPALHMAVSTASLLLLLSNNESGEADEGCCCA